MSNTTTMRAYSLRDDWSTSGNDYASLKEAVKTIDSVTTFKRIPITAKMSNSENSTRRTWVGFLNITETAHEAVTKNGTSKGTLGWVSSDRTLIPPDAGLVLDTKTARNINSQFFIDGPSLPFALGSALNAEVTGSKDHMLLFSSSSPEDGYTLYTVSPMSFISTFGQNIGAGGSRISENSVERSRYMTYLASTAANTHMVVTIREYESEDGAKKERKVFAAFTEQYKPIPQSYILDTITQLESPTHFGSKGEVSRWHMDNFKTIVSVEFPDITADIAATYPELPKKIIAGVEIRTSDTGTEAMTCYGTYRIDGMSRSIPFGEPAVRKHTGKNTEAPKREFSQRLNKVYAEYTTYPQKIVELLSIPLNFATPIERSDYCEAVMAELLMKNKMKKEIKKTLTQIFTDELSSFSSPTAYDAWVLLNELADCEIVSQLADIERNVFMKALGKAVMLESLKK